MFSNSFSRTCTDLILYHRVDASGVYKIYPLGNSTALLAYCDLTTAGGGWMVGSEWFIWQVFSFLYLSSISSLRCPLFWEVWGKSNLMLTRNRWSWPIHLLTTYWIDDLDTCLFAIYLINLHSTFKDIFQNLGFTAARELKKFKKRSMPSQWRQPYCKKNASGHRNVLRFAMYSPSILSIVSTPPFILL